MENQVFVCLITGLTTRYNIPMIEGKGVEYNSPLSQYSVAMQYATENQKTLQSLPSTVLSAIFLSIATEYNLIGDKLTGFQRNTILSKLPKYDIIQGIHLVARLTKKELRELPSYSLDSEYQNDKEVLMAFQGYLTTIRQNLSHSFYSENPEAIRDTDFDLPILSIKTKTSNIKQQKEAYKIHLAILQNSELMGSKVLPYLKTISQNNNLQQASADIRKKIILNLKDWLSSDISSTTKDAIKSICSILEKTSPTSLIEGRFDRVSEAPKKSLKEILAAKQGKEAEPIDDYNPSTNTIDDYSQSSNIEDSDEELESDIVEEDEEGEYDAEE